MSVLYMDFIEFLSVSLRSLMSLSSNSTSETIALAKLPQRSGPILDLSYFLSVLQ